MSASPGSNRAPGWPLCVSDNGAENATLHLAAAPSVTKLGLPLGAKLGVVVRVASEGPTDQVFNDTQPSG